MRDISFISVNIRESVIAHERGIERVPITSFENVYTDKTDIAHLDPCNVIIVNPYFKLEATVMSYPPLNRLGRVIGLMLSLALKGTLLG